MKKSCFHRRANSASLSQAGARLLGSQRRGSDHGFAGFSGAIYVTQTARQHCCCGVQNISLSHSKWKLRSRKKNKLHYQRHWKTRVRPQSVHLFLSMLVGLMRNSLSPYRSCLPCMSLSSVLDGELQWTSDQHSIEEITSVWLLQLTCLLGLAMGQCNGKLVK